MIKKKLVVTKGKYMDSQGHEKRQYMTIGHIHEGQHGHYITLEPGISLAGLYAQQQSSGIGREGDTRLFVNLYDNDPPKSDKPVQTNQPNAAHNQESFNDDIPF